MRKRVLILGSDTKKGQKAFKFFSSYPKKYIISALACSDSKNKDVFNKQIESKYVKEIFVRSKSYYNKLILKKRKIDIYYKEKCNLSKFIKYSDSDIVVFALSSIHSIKSVLSAINEYKDICIVDLDVILYTGDIILNQARNKSVNIYFISFSLYALDLFLVNKNFKEISRICVVNTKGKKTSKKYLKSFRKKYDLKEFKHKIISLYKLYFIKNMFLLNYVFHIPVEKFYFYEQNKDFLNIFVNFKDGTKVANCFNFNINTIYNHYFLEDMDLDNNLVENKELHNLNYRIKKIKPDKNKALLIGIKALKKGGSIPILLYMSWKIVIKKLYEGKLNLDSCLDLMEKIVNKRNWYVKNPDLKTIFALYKEVKKYIYKYKD